MGRDCLERIVNGEDEWDHNAEGDAVEGPLNCASKDKEVQALNNIKF